MDTTILQANLEKKREARKKDESVMVYVGSRLVLDVMGGLNENFVGKTKESVFDQMSVFAMESVVDLIDNSKNKESYSERVVRSYAENYNEEEHISILGYNEKGEVVETVLNNHVDS